MQSHYLPFFPETLPLSKIKLKVSDLHTLYIETYGNREGIPVITLHGGPGSGTSPYFAQFFDPEKYFIILADQRGAGKSEPKGEMRENTTQDLIEDLEKIRDHLKVKKWVVFGGSWGSTLALLYAEAHPEKVLGLILRGIFLGRPKDTNVFVKDGSPAALMHSKEWEYFKNKTTELIQKSGIENLSVQTDEIYHIYYVLLTHHATQNKVGLRAEAAGTLSAWEKFNSYLIPQESEVAWSKSEDGINMALTEVTYFENNCFIKDNQILNAIKELKDIPVHIVQGRYDLVCPPYMADELEIELKKINRDASKVIRHDRLAGHSHKEEAIRDGLITASNQLAEILENKKK